MFYIVDKKKTSTSFFIALFIGSLKVCDVR